MIYEININNNICSSLGINKVFLVLMTHRIIHCDDIPDVSFNFSYQFFWNEGSQIYFRIVFHLVTSLLFMWSLYLLVWKAAFEVPVRHSSEFMIDHSCLLGPYQFYASDPHLPSSRYKTYLPLDFFLALVWI